MDSHESTPLGGGIAVNPAITPLRWKLGPELPAKGAMLKNAAGSLGRNLKSLVGGNPLNADPETIKERQAICNGCEFMKDRRCAKCGCWLQYKTILHAESCPAGKWGQPQS